MVKIDFEFETEHGIFRDAIWLPDGHTYSDAEIESMKIERKNNWIEIITSTPQKPQEPDYVEIDGVRYIKAVDNG